MNFIKSKPGMKLEDYVIISDVHVGFEQELKDKGYRIPNQTITIFNRLKSLRKHGSKLVILGDVKHSIINEERFEVLKFLSKVSQTFKEVIIVKGNHDAGMEYLIRGFKNIKLVSELLIKNFLLIHGHKYASSESMEKAEDVLIGHFHSSFKTKNELGITNVRKTWSVYEFDNELYEKNKRVETHINKVVSFPCFNNFFEGSGEEHGPYSSYLKLDEVFTLDLVKLV